MDKTFVVGNTITGAVKITIELTNGNLRISGSSKGASGQIYDAIREMIKARRLEYAPQWDAERLTKLVDIWERWHLNDIRAGDIVQMEAIRAGTREIAGIMSKQKMPDWYGAACQYLTSLGLYEHEGYLFGHGWKREELPQDVVDFISAILAE